MDFQRTYCDASFLDAYHAKSHKCDKRRWDPKHKANVRKCIGLNSSAAEQLWSRTDLLAPIARHMRRANFRLFLKGYCRWRNTYLRSSHRADVCPAKSLKKHIRRTRAGRGVLKRPCASKSERGGAVGILKRPSAILQRHCLRKPSSAPQVR